MRDIRKRYRNSRSSEHVVTGVNHNKKVKEVSKEVEMFENNNYRESKKEPHKEIEYDRSGKPIMKASHHFDTKRDKKHEADVLKRQSFFESNRREFDEGDIKDFQRKRSKKKKLQDFAFYLSLILIIGGLTLWSTIFSSATIKVNPKYKDVEVSDTFLFFKDDTLIDNASSSLSKNVLKSAPKELNQKATGTITIYNNFSDTPQTLIKNTRFQTSDGKIFRINDSVVVPGKKAGAPGSMQAKVSADSYGAQYNISATDFKIPGFKNTPKYNLFYAKSSSSMTGGVSGTISTVSPDDIAIASRDLKPSLNNMVSVEAGKISHDGYFSLYKNLIINYSDNQSILMSTDQNSYTITASAILISIKKEVLAKMIAEQVLKDNFNQSDLVRIDDISGLTFTFDPSIDFNASNILKVMITGKVRIIWDYNKADIKANLARKKISMFSDVIKNYNSSIVSSSYSTSPFWLRSFPKNIDKIKIEENLK